MKFAFIAAEKARWPVTVMFRILQVSTSGFYASQARAEAPHDSQDRRLRVLIGEAHERSRGLYGSPRVHAELRARGERVSRKRVIRLMQQDGLRGRSRRRWVRTTESCAHREHAPNLLDRDFAAAAPNQRCVGDVTYLRVPQGFLYLAVILDLYSRMIVGWATSGVNDTDLAARALRQALRARRPATGLLHHTDRGSPYASPDYQKALTEAGIQCSMSRPGQCLDNAAMETWFATLKCELSESFASASDANRRLFDYIEVYYNGSRRHSALGYLSPRDFERDRHHVNC